MASASVHIFSITMDCPKLPLRFPNLVAGERSAIESAIDQR
jgi:hypothetical protein